MRASVIIPVWNGADLLPGCLDAVRQQAGDELREIICVDNASKDASAALIAERYPEVRLLRQPVNLGFAGGVNAGIDAARGDVLVLLNQDCIAQPGWLTALGRALEAHPNLGVAGCAISRPDGTVDHVGAEIQRPKGYGRHLAQATAGQLAEADFVTGAAMAIPRPAREAIGPLDEGFYPGYYEDADYCYRARHRGFSVACALEARVVHLARSVAWQEDTIRHHTDQCLARYRFVAKHFDGPETEAFFAAELQDVEEEEYLDRATGRAIAARDVLRLLPDLLQRRHLDLDEPLPAAHRRQLQVGFARVGRRGQATAARLAQIGLVPSDAEQWQAEARRLREALAQPLPVDPATLAAEDTAGEAELRRLEEREYELLRRLYPAGFGGGSVTRREQIGHRLRRLWHVLTGLDQVLQAELQAIRAERMARMRHAERLHRGQLVRLLQAHQARMHLIESLGQQNEQLWHYHEEGLERRLKLLETLIDYDHG